MALSVKINNVFFRSRFRIESKLRQIMLIIKPKILNILYILQGIVSILTFFILKTNNTSYLGKNGNLRALQAPQGGLPPSATDHTGFEAENSALANQIHVQVQPHTAPVSKSGFFFGGMGGFCYTK